MFHGADSGERKIETAESVSKFSEPVEGRPSIHKFIRTYIFFGMFWRLDIVSTT
jgi:hypothetical protein